MIRIFVDANVLFAAADSETGASRQIIQLGLRGQVQLVVSELVIEEARRNLAGYKPTAVEALQEFVAATPFHYTNPTKRQVQTAATYTALKDAPIVAGAKASKVDYLVTLDRKHLIRHRQEIERRSGVKILLPEELLPMLRKGGEIQ